AKLSRDGEARIATQLACQHDRGAVLAAQASRKRASRLGLRSSRQIVPGALVAVRYALPISNRSPDLRQTISLDSAAAARRSGLVTSFTLKRRQLVSRWHGGYRRVGRG